MLNIRSNKNCLDCNRLECIINYYAENKSYILFYFWSDLNHFPCISLISVAGRSSR